MALRANRLISYDSSNFDPAVSNSAHYMKSRNLIGKCVAMVHFSSYPTDPRPRRAAEALVSAGMSVDLICLKEGDHQAKRELVNGVDVTRIPVRRHRGGIFG